MTDITSDTVQIENPYKKPGVKDAIAKSAHAKKENHGPLGRKLILRDGPTPEKFCMIERLWIDAQGCNDGYNAFTGDKWRAFPGEQPLIDAFFKDEPLAQGKRLETRKIKFVMFWGHNNQDEKVITEVIAEPAASAPNVPPALVEALLKDETKRQTAAYHEAHKGVTVSDLDVAFPRTSDGQPLDDDDPGKPLVEYFDKLAAEKPTPSLGDAAAQPPDAEPHFSADKHWRGEYNKLRSKRLPTATMKDDVFTAMVKELIGIGGQSFKVLTCTGEEALKQIADALTAKYDAIVDASSDTPATHLAEVVVQTAASPILSVEKASQVTVYPNYPESPVVVYPMERGGIVYDGIRFSVTLRIGGTWSMAETLMREFTAHREMIDPSCLVRPASAPANVIPMAQTTGPALPMAVGQSAPVPGAAAGAAPDEAGRVPGQTGNDRITGVKKTVNEGKTIIELWGNGQYADHRLSRESDQTFVASMGVVVDQMAVGTTYPVNWIADWVVTAKKNQTGKKYFRDVTNIRNA